LGLAHYGMRQVGRMSYSALCTAWLKAYTCTLVRLVVSTHIKDCSRHCSTVTHCSHTVHTSICSSATSDVPSTDGTGRTMRTDRQCFNFTCKPAHANSAHSRAPHSYVTPLHTASDRTCCRSASRMAPAAALQPCSASVVTASSVSTDALASACRTRRTD